MGYMPRELFSYGACVLAQLKLSGEDHLKEAAEIAAQYERSFDDTGLREDWVAAAERCEAAVKDMFPEHANNPEMLIGILKTLSSAIQKYDHSGRKKRKKLLGGTFFNKAKEPIRDKPSAALADLAAYHMLLSSGQVSASKLS